MPLALPLRSPQDCLQNFLLLPAPVALGLLLGLWPVARSRRDLADYLVMLLRKVMFSREAASRCGWGLGAGWGERLLAGGDDTGNDVGLKRAAHMKHGCAPASTPNHTNYVQLLSCVTMFPSWHPTLPACACMHAFVRARQWWNARQDGRGYLDPPWPPFPGRFPALRLVAVRGFSHILLQQIRAVAPTAPAAGLVVAAGPSCSQASSSQVGGPVARGLRPRCVANKALGATARKERADRRHTGCTHERLAHACGAVTGVPLLWFLAHCCGAVAWWPDRSGQPLRSIALQAATTSRCPRPRTTPSTPCPAPAPVPSTWAWVHLPRLLQSSLSQLQAVASGAGVSLRHELQVCQAPARHAHTYIRPVNEAMHAPPGMQRKHKPGHLSCMMYGGLHVHCHELLLEVRLCLPWPWTLAAHDGANLAAMQVMCASALPLPCLA